jgi:SET and MYND domain-containing protein
MGAMEVHDFGARGKGWRATQDLEPGMLLLASKPVAMVLDSDVDDDGSEASNVDTALLIIAVAKAIKQCPKLWGDMGDLYPRQKDLSTLKPWTCKDEDPALDLRVTQQLEQLSQLSAEEKKQLMLIVRFNNLGCETNAEQLCYPSRYQQWGGVGLYIDASYFNHSCTPNVNRYSVGDIMYFRTNSAVAKGQELCITYIESEMLSEPMAVRNNLLGKRDFKLGDGAEQMGDQEMTEDKAQEDDESEDDEEGMPRICGNDEMMHELFSMPPKERLDAMDELYQVESALYTISRESAPGCYGRALPGRECTLYY